MSTLTVDALAKLFHENYERLAPDYGYTTREDTRTFDPESANGRLMLAVCGEVAHHIDATRSPQPPKAAGAVPLPQDDAAGNYGRHVRVTPADEVEAYGDAREAAAVGKLEQDILAVIDERDHRESVIDRILDAVLGSDRPNWSSVYGYEDAALAVEERESAAGGVPHQVLAQPIRGRSEDYQTGEFPHRDAAGINGGCSPSGNGTPDQMEGQESSQHPTAVGTPSSQQPSAVKQQMMTQGKCSGKVVGYLRRERALEIELDADVPDWIIGRDVRVTIVMDEDLPMHSPDELNRLAAKWRGENGDYPEAKRDCADELEAVLAAQSATPPNTQEPQ